MDAIRHAHTCCTEIVHQDVAAMLATPHGLVLLVIGTPVLPAHRHRRHRQCSNAGLFGSITWAYIATHIALQIS
jgi:hypothetical protein